MKVEITKALITVGLGLLTGGAMACAQEAGADGLICVTGQQIACSCPGGVDGVQTCNVLGTYDPCMCGDVEMADTDTDTDTDDDAKADSDSGDSTTGDDDEPVCGNGNIEPGECDPEGTNYCAIDCGDEGSTGDGTTGGMVNSCDGVPVFVGMVPNVPSVWELNGVQGFGAGRMMCQNMGADDVCTYDQLLEAEQAGEFAAMPAGTTAWVHRTGNALYMGQNITADPRSRCADWTYSTNHINDGEYVEFAAPGVATYHLDTDPASFPSGVMDCGGINRAIFCCDICTE